MLCAQLAVQTIVRAFAQLSFAAPSLAPYERTWQHTLGTELRVGRYFRKLYSQLQDKHIDALLRFAARNGLMELIHHKADFDWHSELIMAMLKHTAVRRTVLGSFLSSFS
jgi:flavin-dependent dehydrogenase